MSDSQIPIIVCHDPICVMTDSQIPKSFLNCHDHISVRSDSQIPKSFVMTIYASCQTHKLLKTFVMTIYVCVMSDKQIPKICLSCTTETLHFRVMLESQIPQNVCHDHIRVMSDSRMPKNVHHVPRKFNIFCVMSDSYIYTFLLIVFQFGYR